MWRTFSQTVLTVALLAIAALPGCSKGDDAREYQTVEGTIERIDLANGVVTLAYFSKKHDREARVTGKTTDETEILINGALASLKDLREGERVTVVGWVRGHGANREVVAQRVHADRAETIRRREQPAAPPSSDPATDPGSPP